MRSIIFDLDGTLIDSADSILEGFRRVANKILGSEAPFQIPLTRALVGPPLDRVLQSIANISDPKVLAKGTRYFSEYYDTEGYKNSLVYFGIEIVLEKLVQENHLLYIATNKRYIPTIKIIEHLKWKNFFSSVYSIDMNPESRFRDKSEMLEVLLNEKNLIQPIYVGDRYDDYVAAQSNGIDFIHAAWGYGQEDEHSYVNSAIKPLDLLSIIGS